MALAGGTCFANGSGKADGSACGGLQGTSVTRLLTPPRPLPPWVAGVIEETDPKLLPPGTLADGENFVPQKSPRLAARGGSRILLTLHDDTGPELTSVPGLFPKAATGAVAIGHSVGQSKHYGYALTSDMVLAGASEALSRSVFPATWNKATPARPVIANLFEKLYVADATLDFATRSPIAALDSAIGPAITVPTFAFVPGGAGARGLFAYCLEEYNNVLFIAGYGDEEVSTGDDPALVRHSYLGQAPDAAAGAGFDKNAYLTIGSKGDRVTAMKKGRGLLVITKANELYRVTGFGRAYPGWQYQVDGIHNTLGMGVENPLALEHAEGFWFGIGKQGPFRTDGYQVEPLVGPRQRTWAGISQLGASWVRYHPDRRLVLFGVHVTSGAPDATYPWVFMAWDCDRSVWQPNWKLAGTPRFFVAQAVASSAVTGPSAPPSAPVTSLVTAQDWTASWTNGDATAETEYWVQDLTGGGAWVLTQVLAPGVATFPDPGPRTNENAYYWRVRHRKSGVFSAYSATAEVFTLIAPPIWSPSCVAPGIARITVTPMNKFGTHILQHSVTGFGGWTTIDTRTTDTVYSVNDFTSPIQFYRVMTHNGTWPSPDSAWSDPRPPVGC